ncbi:hypothetical protein LCM02_04900 [Lutimonas saemankumensis]|uniref:tetratricopeptide repeat protein n=1 Tax=Lutimonas saemankumensis TaxID=483016 RepID=UPI001CD7F25B|nr:hypothetical protein [Lutimonas saemankumensis]MCA0931780.1 hypothetical protein [Lutimonas saemankumensis]
MNFKKFFAELKRRKVYNVAVTYAVVSWIISQIVTQLTSTFEAPLWVAKMMTVILIAGFPIAIILAWAFEMSPEGMVRTTSEAAKTNPYPPGKKKPLTGKLFIGVLVLIIIGQFAFYKFNQNESYADKNEEVSIAVLPLEFQSQDSEKEYLANGVGDAIRAHLSKIKGLRVTPRISVEQYRGTTKTATEIGDELNVTYLLEGSFFMVDNKVVLSVNLVSTEEEDQIVSKEYNRDYSEIIQVQSEVAKTVAKEISVKIGPEAMEKIETIPTENTLAYDHFLKGNEFYFKANSLEQKNREWMELLEEATLSYNQAIMSDSSFAQTYVGLARVDYKRNLDAAILEDSYLENVFLMANKALELDPSLADAYSVRGLYHTRVFKPQMAVSDSKKALEIDPNNIESLYNLSLVYRFFDLNFSKSLEMLEKIESLVHSQEELWRLYGEYAEFYVQLDDLEKEEYYLKKQQDIKPGEIVNFWFTYARTKRMQKCLDYVDTHQKEINQYRVSSLAGCYYFGGDYQNAIRYYDAMEQLVQEENYNYAVVIRDSHRYGHTLIETGNKVKGMEMMQRQIQINKRLIELNRPDYGLIYDLAGIYSFLGQKEEAFRWIDLFNEGEGWLKYGSVYSLVQIDPLFDSIREDPAFINWVETGGKKLEKARREINTYLEKENN